MSEKFDPAPVDKHATDPKDNAVVDQNTSDRLKKGLEGTFPASDPVDVTQPAEPAISKQD